MNKQKTVSVAKPSRVPPGREAKQCHCGKWFTLPACHAARHTSCSDECRDRLASQRIAKRKRSCAECGNSFVPRSYQLKTGGGKFCSISCSTRAYAKTEEWTTDRIQSGQTYKANLRAGKFKRAAGPDHPQFMGRKICDGYVYVWVPRLGYVQEHRLVVEQAIGRELQTWQIVHHKNHNKLDNRFENLEVVTRAEHIELHREEIVAARRAVKCKTS